MHSRKPPQLLPLLLFFEPKTAYEFFTCLEFRRVLFRSDRSRVGEPRVDQGVVHRQQAGAREQEEHPVQQGQLQPHGGAEPAGPQSRYPTPTTVSTSGGRPSLRRRFMTVTRTVLVNGSACSSQTRSSSSSELTTTPSAAISTSSTPNSLRVRRIGRSSLVTSRLAGSRRTSWRSSRGGNGSRARRASARTRATSSSQANGLPR